MSGHESGLIKTTIMCSEGLRKGTLILSRLILPAPWNQLLLLEGIVKSFGAVLCGKGDGCIEEEWQMQNGAGLAMDSGLSFRLCNEEIAS